MFKKLLSMALATVMVMGMGTTAFAAESQNNGVEKTVSANGYDFTVTERTTTDFEVSRTYTKNAADISRSISSEEETKAMLLALGMDEDEVSAILATLSSDELNLGIKK